MPSLGPDRGIGQFDPDPAAAAVEIEATCKVSGQTGVEMEALTAVSVAALTVYDMCKAVDRAMVIADIRLRHKSGGKSGGSMARETPAGDLMSVDAARAAIVSGITLLAREDIALTDGLGRVLAAPLVARRSQPPMAVSAMDGYAARAGDVTEVPAVPHPNRRGPGRRRLRRHGRRRSVCGFSPARRCPPAPIPSSSRKTPPSTATR